MMDTEAIPEALRQPLVLRALEELQMLTKDELERERYEARRKAQLDLTSSLCAAREEGREEGREQGRLEGLKQGEKQGIIHAIHLCEDLLKRPETPRVDLMSRSLEALTRLLDDLQTQVRTVR